MMSAICGASERGWGAWVVSARWVWWKPAPRACALPSARHSARTAATVSLTSRCPGHALRTASCTGCTASYQCGRAAIGTGRTCRATRSRRDPEQVVLLGHEGRRLVHDLGGEQAGVVLDALARQLAVAGVQFDADGVPAQPVGGQR